MRNPLDNPMLDKFKTKYTLIPIVVVSFGLLAASIVYVVSVMK